MTIQEILTNPSATNTIAALKEKPFTLRPWKGGKGLQREYNSKYHPVMDKAKYPDIVNDDGSLEEVTRITLDFQQLAVKRMTELVCGIPVKRVYKAENDKQKEIAVWLENIFERNRIESVNVDRCNMLFAGCEIMTLWYAVEQKNSVYGFNSPLKLRCRTFSPMLGDELYPLFDEYGDMIAMSIGYTRRKEGKNITYFDCYTADKHIKWSNENGDWTQVENDDIKILKIPAIYGMRPTPIWEETSKLVYEMEWALSRNGNYLRKNSKPLFVVFADEQIAYGDEEEGEEGRAKGRGIMQYPKGSNAAYVTWQQAVENLKFYINELRNSFFTQLQLPDWSYEKMSQQAMSGESRKQLFIDSQLKVKDEGGRLLEFFDREVNVVKAFLKIMAPAGYEEDIDALAVENIITPFSITDDKDTISNLVTATGGKAIMSQREAVENLGWSKDVDKTMDELAAEQTQDVFPSYE